MKITLADKFIAYLALFSGLTISAVAIWYSVAGLVSIFAAAVIPIIVMGVVLEISKLIATVWLKLNWSRAPVFIRTYLLAAIAILMVITSMGIFGFLSKAHSDAGLVSGDVQAKIAVYDEKIKTERENIDAARKALTQMDAQVNERLSRSTDDRGAERAVQIRRQQQAERTRLQTDISRSQSAIAKLNEERAPIAAEVRKVEAEVGPIKYIASFIYGSNPDANLLEKAVTWVIIIIVVVFDPLAVILLLASQYSFQWFRQAKEENELTPDPYVADVGDKPTADELVDEANAKLAEIEKPEPEVWPFPTYEEITPKTEKSILEQHPYLNNGDFWKKPEGWVEVPPQVYKPEPVVEEKVEADESKFKILPELQKELGKTDDKMVANVLWTDELQTWREANPNENIYEIQRMFDAGEIEQLPWNDSKKKINYMIKEQGQQVLKTRE
jgi:hypothetical protein